VRTAAIIPARGGSKGIPGKNLRPVGGLPLVARAILSARSAKRIDDVYVSTDSAEIANVAEEYGALVIQRPADISGDEASSESALLHALDVLDDVDVVVFIQATSPFIDPDHLDQACEMVQSKAFDSVFSGTDDHGFRWEQQGQAFIPWGHDMAKRPRRQDLPHRVLETGAFYVFTAVGLRESGSRFHGTVGCVVVDRADSMEIDSPEELELANTLALSRQLPQDIGPLDAVVFDFDGVHTDDRVQVDQHGVESVSVSRSDGYGISLLRQAGYRMVIISTETNPVVSARAKKLQIEVIQGQSDKARALSDWMAAHSLDPARVAFLGNDVNDAPALTLVGWPVVPRNAHRDVKGLARIVLSRAGGDGAVRELADLILRSHREE
jgi:YrbI family 3-deoxy-D-manno-octulosonate 8-phosphate phosphatase